MARQAKLRKKKVGKAHYWYTKAGGNTYFGRVDEVTHKDVKKQEGGHDGGTCSDKPPQFFR